MDVVTFLLRYFLRRIEHRPADGYPGRVVRLLLHTSDQPFYNVASQVVSDQLRRAGVAIDAAYNKWLDVEDAGQQTRLKTEIQLAAFEAVPFVPEGRYMPSAEWRSSLSHPLKGPAPVFWEISKN